MDRDGTREGFDLALTRKLADAVPVPVIASGGVGHPEHFVSGVVEGHASAVLAASIFHFGDFTISEPSRLCRPQALTSGFKIRLKGEPQGED